MLNPLMIEDEGREQTIQCRHADVWPPSWARSGQPVESLRARGHLNDEQYERAKTWERVCGLLTMSPTKCPTCPHALRENGLPVVPSQPLVAPAVSKRKWRKR